MKNKATAWGILQALLILLAIGPISSLITFYTSSEAIKMQVLAQTGDTMDIWRLRIYLSFLVFLPIFFIYKKKKLGIYLHIGLLVFNLFFLPLFGVGKFSIFGLIFDLVVNAMVGFFLIKPLWKDFK